MNNITFKNIYKAGQLVLENDLYAHVHNPEVLLQYDSNFIAFKRMPTIEEFTAAQNYLKAYHEKNGQKHVRFYFPEGEELTPELTEHLKGDDYTIGFLELFAIKPERFPAVNHNSDIEVQKVSNENMDAFLSFQYEQDARYGTNYAEQKQAQHVRNFNDEKKQQIIAFCKGKAAGTVDVIISDETAEIDGLIVHKDFQKKGIGSRLQKFVMEQFSDKIVILVADGEDTPKEMYRKQNYQYLGFQFEALKVYK